MSKRDTKDAPEDVFARRQALRDRDDILHRVAVPVDSFALPVLCFARRREGRDSRAGVPPRLNGLDLVTAGAVCPRSLRARRARSFRSPTASLAFDALMRSSRVVVRPGDAAWPEQSRGHGHHGPCATFWESALADECGLVWPKLHRRAVREDDRLLVLDKIQWFEVGLFQVRKVGRQRCDSVLVCYEGDATACQVIVRGGGGVASVVDYSQPPP